MPINFTNQNTTYKKNGFLKIQEKNIIINTRRIF